MIGELLKSISPDVAVQAIKSNPGIVLNVLQKFELFHLFGQSLSEEQQIAFSRNMHRVTDYMRSEKGKAGAKEFVAGFIQFTEATK